MHYPVIPRDLMWAPPLSRSDVQIFNHNSSGSNWFSWSKPPGVTMAYMLAIAGGAGGGAGFTRTAGSAGGGGGGGACSGIARLIIPAFYLPDTLYVQVGCGGIGGRSSTLAGASGLNSFVSYGHSTTAPSVLLASGVNAPGGGGAGSGAAVGSAGTVPTIATSTTAQLIGHWFGTVGLIGSTGGAVAGGAGTSVTAWAAIPLSPGAGGAGCTTTDFAGGGQTATAATDWNFLNFPITAGAVAPGGSGTVLAINGSAGVVQWKPFFMSGGGGGASNNSGSAGAGGPGGIGCGGGGGGAGATGGAGGNGGNGLVAIISW